MRTAEIEGQVEYAGFGRRFLAGLIDMAILIIPSFPTFYLQSQNKTAYFGAFLFGHLLWIVYEVGFLAKFGQTPGKMVMKIQVRRLDLSPIGWREALARHSVNILLSAFTLVGIAITLSRVSDEVIQAMSVSIFSWDEQNMEKMKAALDTYKSSHPYYQLDIILSNVWIYSEFITMMFNEKRRAVHDFIAGTVVVRLH